MTSYDPHRWTDHLFDIRGSMVREIVGRVAVFVLWALCVTALLQWGGPWVQWLRIPGTCHGIVGGALGLLLVFRTNASYDRFWEGRKLWGGIVNETRNLVRSSATLLSGEPETIRELTLYTIAFAWSAKSRLQGRKELGPVVTELSAGAASRLLAAEHVPLAVCRHISQVLEAARVRGTIDSYRLGLIDQNTQLLMDYLGGCERIHATPLPYAYAVHLRRALIFFFLTLPFALAADYGWSTVPAMLITCYIFFGIEEIGVEIEDPFGDDTNDIPLEQICASIERVLRDAALRGLPGSP